MEVGFRELASKLVDRVARLDADHVVGWSELAPGMSRITLPDGVLEETQETACVSGSASDGTTLCLALRDEVRVLRASGALAQWRVTTPCEAGTLCLLPGSDAVAWLQRAPTSVKLVRLDLGTGRIRSAALDPTGPAPTGLRWVDAERLVLGGRVYRWGAEPTITNDVAPEAPPPPTGLEDGAVRVTLRRAPDALEATFTATADDRLLGRASFPVEAAPDVEARALLFHRHRTLLAPLASGRLALLRYDTSTWDRPPP